jgi:exosortase/archaeosortase
MGTARQFARQHAKGLLTLSLIAWLVALVTWIYKIMPYLSIGLFIAGFIPLLAGVFFLRMSSAH